MSASGAFLILAEGFSGDPHYGKTMHGVLRYRRDDVVAILDSTRAGESEQGVPIVATWQGRSRCDPRRRSSASRPRADDSRRPGGTCCAMHPARDRRSRTACTSSSRDDPELAALAAAFGVTLTDLRRPPADSTSDRREPRGARQDRPHRRLRLRDREDDGLARARPRGPGPRDRVVFVPTGQTGIAIAGWGISVDSVVADFIAGAAERLVVEGSERGGELLLVEGQGSLSHPAVFRRHARAHPRLGPARLRALPPGRRNRGRRLSGLSAALAAGAGRAARADLADRAGAPASPASR